MKLTNEQKSDFAQQVYDLTFNKFYCRDCSAPLATQEEQDKATMCGDEKTPCPVCGYWSGMKGEDEK